MAFDINLMLAQSYAIIKIFIWSVIVIGGLFLIWFSTQFNHKIELNKKFGNTIEIREYRARKVKKNGMILLKPFMLNKTFIYPDSNELMSKKGKQFFLRIFMLDELNYCYLKPAYGEKKLTLIPQDILYLYMAEQKRIIEKHRKEAEFISKYGGIIAMGIVCVSFVIAIFLMKENISQAMNLGASLLSEASKHAACQGQVVTSA